MEDLNTNAPYLQSVLDNANPAWVKAVKKSIMQAARKYRTFTTDDVWAGLVEQDVTTHEPRAIGAIMRLAAKKKVIEKVPGVYIKSRRAACHGRPLQAWRRVEA